MIKIPGLQDHWVAALKEDRYRLGVGFLRQLRRGEPEYCPLGILCDVASSLGYGSWEDELFFRVPDGRRCLDYPPHELLKEADISPRKAIEIVMVNDSRFSSSQEIAAFIEGLVVLNPLTGRLEPC